MLPIIVLISWKKFTPRRVEILTLISILFLITKKSSSKWALILWSSKWIIFIFITLKKTILGSLVSKIIWLTFSIIKKFLWIWSLKILVLVLVLSCLTFWIVKKFLLVLIHLTKFLRPSKRLRLFLLLFLLLNWLIVIKKIIVVTFCWKILAFLVLKKIITFISFKKCILITFVFLGIIIWFLLILIAIVEKGLFNFKFIFIVFLHRLVLILLRLIIRFLLIKFGSTIKKRCFFLRSLIILIKKTSSFFSFFFIYFILFLYFLVIIVNW